MYYEINTYNSRIEIPQFSTKFSIQNFSAAHNATYFFLLFVLLLLPKPRRIREKKNILFVCLFMDHHHFLE